MLVARLSRQVSRRCSLCRLTAESVSAEGDPPDEYDQEMDGAGQIVEAECVDMGIDLAVGQEERADD